jgi:hypothetical protein
VRIQGGDELMFREMPLVRPSLCPCGFNILHDHIQVGTRYIVDEDRPIVGSLICGGCGKKLSLNLVPVRGRDGARGGYLPLGIFQEIN